MLADGSVPLTAFLPTDRAFRRLAHDLTGKWYGSEAKVFGALAGALGVDTIENVLLYHVVPGATISYRQALRSNGAVLNTALSGTTVTVKVSCWFIVTCATTTATTATRSWWRRTSIAATSRSPTASTGCFAPSTSRRSGQQTTEAIRP